MGAGQRLGLPDDTGRGPGRAGTWESTQMRGAGGHLGKPLLPGTARVPERTAQPLTPGGSCKKPEKRNVSLEKRAGINKHTAVQRTCEKSCDCRNNVTCRMTSTCHMTLSVNEWTKSSKDEHHQWRTGRMSINYRTLNLGLLTGSG